MEDPKPNLNDISSGRNDQVNPGNEGNINELSTAPVSPEISTSSPEEYRSDLNTPIPLNTEPFVSTPQPQEEIKEVKAKKESKINFFSELPKNKNFKKILIGASIGVLALVGVGLATYFIWFANPKITVEITTNQNGVDILVNKNQYRNIDSPFQIMLPKGSYEVIVVKEGFSSLTKKLDITGQRKTESIDFVLTELASAQKIGEQDALFPVFDRDSQSLIYFEKSEIGYEIKEKRVSEDREFVLAQKIAEPIKVTWSPSYRQLVAKVINTPTSKDFNTRYIETYGDGEKTNWSIDLEKKDLINISLYNLNPVIKNVSFSPEGNQIVYFYQSGETRTIATARPDGSEYQIIIPEIKTVQFEPDVAWSPDGSNVAIFANTENGAVRTDDPNVFIYNFEARQIRKITSDDNSHGALFSPNGRFVAYQSGTDVYAYDLFAKDQDIKPTKIGEGIFLDHCSWLDGENIVIYSNKDGLIAIVKASTEEKRNLDYKKDSIGQGVRKIISGNGRIYAFTAAGIFELAVPSDI